MPFETVPEHAAKGPVAAIYADIKATMGIAVVNLIWRRLAADPEAISWAWARLRPLYASGAVPQAGWRLRHEIRVPKLAAIDAAALAKVGISHGELDTVHTVLRTYERGNAQNLIALCALRRSLDPSWPGALANPSAHVSERAAEAADRITQPIPPLPAMTSLPTAAQAAVRQISAYWVPAEQTGMIPSVFRHLALWPALLELMRDRLAGLEACATPPLVDLSSKRAVRRAAELAMPLGQELGLAAKPAPALHDWTLDIVTVFIEAMIGRGVVIVPALQRALPPPEEI